MEPNRNTQESSAQLEDTELDQATGGAIVTGGTSHQGSSSGGGVFVPIAGSGASGGQTQQSSGGSSLVDLVVTPSPGGPIPIPYPHF